MGGETDTVAQLRKSLAEDPAMARLLVEPHWKKQLMLANNDRVESSSANTSTAQQHESDYVVVEDKNVDHNDNEKRSSDITFTDARSSAPRDISIAAADKWQAEVLADPKHRLAMSAFTVASFTDLLTNPTIRARDVHAFNVRIPREGFPVTNQRASGRCWLFASTNVFRIALSKRYNLSSFELSQAYLFFWDKLEKANYFLESILDTAREPEDGRLVQELLTSPVGDGGQWDMVANLVTKYGLVPQSLFPDSFNAKSSAAMDALVTMKLREDALRLRKLAASPLLAARDAIPAAKDEMLREIHRILTLTLGPVPAPDKPFTWEYTDADGTYHSLQTTPLKFAASLSDSAGVRACGGTDVHRLFSLVHDPRNATPSLLTVARLGNVYGGRPVTYVNVSMRTLKDAAVAMLRRGLPVFFGCDVDKSSDRLSGVMDPALRDLNAGFNVALGMDKAQRLRVKASAMTHAMVLTGVQVEEDGRTTRWRVENSWSDGIGDKGYMVATDPWMDSYTFQAVVDPAFVSKEVRDVLKTKAKVLPLWDPMGALA